MQELERNRVRKTSQSTGEASKRRTSKETLAPTYTPQQIKNLVHTASKGGAIGTKPTVVTKWVAKLGWKGLKVLDYGCGPMEFQTDYLRKQGMIVTPYDIGYPRKILNNRYDIIALSNVINVQPHMVGIRQVIDDIFRVFCCNKANDFSFAIFNYPKSPRKIDISPESLIKIIRREGLKVDKLPGSTLVYRLRV